MHSIKVENIIKDNCNNKFPFELLSKLSNPHKVNLISYKVMNASEEQIHNILSSHEEDNSIYWLQYNLNGIFILNIFTIEDKSELEIEDTLVKLLDLRIFL